MSLRAKISLAYYSYVENTYYSYVENTYQYFITWSFQKNFPVCGELVFGDIKILVAEFRKTEHQWLARYKHSSVFTYRLGC
jgi:hypothetical protein